MIDISCKYPLPVTVSKIALDVGLPSFALSFFLICLDSTAVPIFVDIFVELTNTETAVVTSSIFSKGKTRAPAVPTDIL